MEQTAQPEKAPQLPVSPQETQIQSPSFLERISAQKKKILIGLGSVLGILILAGAVFGVYKYAQNQIPLEPVGEPTPEVATPTPDPTTEWETFTTGILSFEYPPTWFIKETTSGFFVFLPNESLSPQLAPISLDTRLEKEYAQSIIEHKEGIEDLVVEDISIAGKPATKISGKLGPGFREGTPVIAIVINYQNKAVVFEFSGEGETYQQTFDLILSTFKFLEESAGEKVFCKDPRLQVCTMECITNPPYICGSDGESYCTECQACADLKVEWYVIQDQQCE